MLDNIIRGVLKFKDVGSFGLKEKIFFFREVGYLIEGGISIIEAITLIKENSSNYAIKEVCENVYESLKKGENLHRSMIRLNNYFNEGDVNIVRSGELSGELPRVLKYLGEEYEYIYDIKNKYIGAIIYPVIIFGVSIIAIYIIFRFVLPGVLSIVNEFEGVTLPWTTQMLMLITNFVMNYSWHILIILLLIIFGVSIILSTDEGRKQLDYKLFTFPIIGKITRYYLLIKFLRYMRLLMNSGMNYIDIFQSLKLIMGNIAYKDMLESMLVAVRKGDRVTDVLSLYPLIVPADVVMLIKSGEQTASTTKSIENGLWFYEQEFNKIINNLSKIIEPFLMLFVGLIVAFIALSVFGVIGSVLDSVQQL